MPAITGSPRTANHSANGSCHSSGTSTTIAATSATVPVIGRHRPGRPARSSWW